MRQGNKYSKKKINVLLVEQIIPPPKKRRSKEKDRKRKADKRGKDKEEKPKKKKELKNEDFQDFPTSQSLKKAVYRLKGKLPQNRQRYAALIKELLNASSPMKKAALRAKGISTDDSRPKRLRLERVCKEAVKESKMKRSNRLVQWAKKIVSNHSVNFRRTSHIPEEEELIRIPRARKRLREDIEQSIESFFNRPDTSTELPHRKTVKNKEPRKVLNMTLRGAWEAWKSETGFSVALSTFACRRPSNVKLLDSRPWVQCLCEYCCNIELKVNALNRMAKRKVLKSRYEVLEMTQCPKENGNYRKECYERRCQECGCDKLKSVHEDVLRDENQEIKWRRWERVVEVHEGKTVRKQKLVDKSGTVASCMKEFIADCIPYSKHMFIARWQYQQYQKAVDVLNADTVIYHMDFAQNYMCEYQEAIQAVHWGKNTVTVHPIICTYLCQQHNAPVRECIDIISNDHKHDVNALETFLNKARKHLKEQGMEFRREIQFSDGCAAQYRCKGAFADISYGSNVERHYLGARRGKGPCDGEGGVLKSLCDRAVRSGNAMIRNAEEMARYLTENHQKQSEDECLHSRRHIIYVSTGEINRARQDRTVLKTVQGTLGIHMVKGIRPGEIQTRKLSCFCPGCEGEDGPCLNEEHVECPKDHKLTMTRESRNTRTTDVAQTERRELAEELEITELAEETMIRELAEETELTELTAETVMAELAEDMEIRAEGTEIVEETEIRAEEIEVGAHETEIGAKETEIGAEETEIGAQETEIRAQETEIRAQETEMGEEMEIGTQETERGAQETEIRAQETEIGEEMEIGTQETEIGAQETEIGAQEKEIGAEETEIGAEETEIGAHETEIRAQETEIGEEMEVGTQETEIGAQETEIGAQEKEIGAEETEIGAEDTEIGEEMTTTVNAGLSISNEERQNIPNSRCYT